MTPSCTLTRSPLIVAPLAGWTKYTETLGRRADAATGGAPVGMRAPSGMTLTTPDWPTPPGAPWMRQ